MKSGLTLTLEHLTSKSIGIIYLLGAKFGIDQVKESKDIERTIQWTVKSGLTLTFEHVTCKYSLRATFVPSMGLIK